MSDIHLRHATSVAAKPAAIQPARETAARTEQDPATIEELTRNILAFLDKSFLILWDAGIPSAPVRHASLEAMADNGRPPAYVSSSELGRHLGLTDVQVSYLARTGVLAREPDPTHPGRYKYELVTSLTTRGSRNSGVTSAGNEPRERS